jgi:hypothetical protein
MAILCPIKFYLQVRVHSVHYFYPCYEIHPHSADRRSGWFFGL